MKQQMSRSRMGGFTLAELLIVAGILSTIPSAKYTAVKERAKQTVCTTQLHQIGRQIIAYQLSNGYYPKATFYPKNPLTDADSILVIIDGKQAGLAAARLGALGRGGGSVWVCPALPEALQKRGLTFVYNDDLAGATRVSDPSRKWVLIEMNCVSAKVPPPHPAGYNILFADGHVITSKRLPRKITAAHKAQIEQLRTDVQRLLAATH